MRLSSLPCRATPRQGRGDQGKSRRRAAGQSGWLSGTGHPLRCRADQLIMQEGEREEGSGANLTGHFAKSRERQKCTIWQLNGQPLLVKVAKGLRIITFWLTNVKKWRPGEAPPPALSHSSWQPACTMRSPAPHHMHQPPSRAEPPFPSAAPLRGCIYHKPLRGFRGNPRLSRLG